MSNQIHVSITIKTERPHNPRYKCSRRKYLFCSGPDKVTVNPIDFVFIGDPVFYRNFTSVAVEPDTTVYVAIPYLFFLRVIPVKSLQCDR